MAQVSTGPFYRVLCMETAAMKGKKKKNALAWKVRCAMCTRHEGQQQSRRLVNISPLLIHFLSLPNRAIAGSIFDKYVKRKKLEPLEVYVPAIILTQLQIKDLEKTLEVEQPQYAACRSLLRSGPAASLRVNVRAVAQYATEAGYSDAASTSVDTCLRALEELDSLLLRASRNDREPSINLMKTNAGIALAALDRLLQTVPPDVLDKGKAVADAYRTPSETEAPETLDAEMKQLESIL